MASTTAPRLRLRDATPADLSRLTDLFFDAFKLDTGNRLMHPNGVSASAKEKFSSSFFPSAETDSEPGRGPNGEHPKKGEKIIMVAELLPPEGPQDGPGEIVALSRWTVNREPREEWDWDHNVPLTAEMMGEGVNLEVANAFIGDLKRLERKHTRGDPHIGMRSYSV